MERRELIKEIEKQEYFKSGYHASLMKEAVRHLKGENLFSNVGDDKRSNEFSCGFETCRCGKKINKKRL